MHTDCIISQQKNTNFFQNVNSSAMHNVSTQFADGGEFAWGEIEFQQCYHLEDP